MPVRTACKESIAKAHLWINYSTCTAKLRLARSFFCEHLLRASQAYGIMSTGMSKFRNSRLWHHGGRVMLLPRDVCLTARDLSGFVWHS